MRIFQENGAKNMVAEIKQKIMMIREMNKDMREKEYKWGYT